MTSRAWPHATRAPRRGTVAPLIVAAATIAAAVAGALLGERIGAVEEPRREPPAVAGSPVVRAGAASLRLPDGWWTADPAFRLTGASAARGASGPMADALLAVVPPEDPSLLPAALRSGVPPVARPIELTGGTPAWRYDDLTDPSGARVSAVVVPTADGVVTLACRVVAGAPAEECAGVADRLDVGAAAVLPPTEDAAARIALPAAIARLNEQRRDGRRAVAGGRVDAARSIATAYAEAAASLGPLAGGRAAALPPLLTELARAHRVLARAHAGRNRRAAIAAAGRITRGEARLGALVGELAPPA